MTLFDNKRLGQVMQNSDLKGKERYMYRYFQMTSFMIESNYKGEKTE